MADTLVESAAYENIWLGEMLCGPYWISPTTAVIVYVNSAQDTVFRRTTDGGETWSAITTIHAGTVRGMAVFWDQEVPGDAGTLLHVLTMDTAGTDEVSYRTVDVSDASLGTDRTVDNGVTVSGNVQSNRCSITKTRNGNLLCAFSTQTEIECYRSVDAGATWVDRADPMETANQEDILLLFPANTADDADAAAFFWDRSANAITVKMYDDSDGASGSWTESAIVTANAEQFTRNMDGAVRHSDGFILGVAHSDADFSGDDLLTWTVDPDSIASPTVTTTTNVFTNQNEAAQCCLFINQQNDDVYIGYLKGGVWLATVDVVYHISTDGMSTWGSEQPYSEAAADDLRCLAGGRTAGDGGGFFQPCWFNDDLFDIFVNLVNDVAFPPAVTDLPYNPWMQRAPILAQ